MGRRAYNKDIEKKILDGKKKEFLDAVEKHFGNVSAAAREIGIAPVTAYMWISKDSRLRQAVDNIRAYARHEVLPDFYEQKLYEKAEQGDTTAIIYGLKSYAAHRGFGSDNQVNIAIQNNINFNPVDFFAGGNEGITDVEWEEG